MACVLNTFERVSSPHCLESRPSTERTVAKKREEVERTNRAKVPPEEEEVLV